MYKFNIVYVNGIQDIAYGSSKSDVMNFLSSVYGDDIYNDVVSITKAFFQN